MRKSVLTIVMLLGLVTYTSAQTVDQLFEEFGGMNHVESVVITKNMMSMAKGFVKEINDVDLLKKVRSVRILNMENDDDLCRDFVERTLALRTSGYDTMVNRNEDGERTVVLVKTKGKTIKEVVILDVDASECSLVHLKGKFKSSDLKKLSD